MRKIIDTKTLKFLIPLIALILFYLPAVAAEEAESLFREILSDNPADGAAELLVAKVVKQYLTDQPVTFSISRAGMIFRGEVYLKFGARKQG